MMLWIVAAAIGILIVVVLVYKYVRTSKYVGFIHDILDEKMTMKEVDDYIKDNF